MLDGRKTKLEKRIKRHRRIRSRIFGTADKPRLCVFKSGRHIYAQLIDDENSRVLLSASDFQIKKAKTGKLKDKEGLKGKNLVSFGVGLLIAQKAIEKKITHAAFDRAGYMYHGNIKSLADGAREGGLKF